jgi:hypothetical protein
VTAHILPIFWGDGANGKSTLVDAVMHALGDYADAADPDLLRARTFDAHPTGVADLHGLRLALLHESDAGHRLAEGTVKRLTGGDRLKARRMREDFWSFQPSHTFVMLTNHKPQVGGTDEGIWRRLRLVPFGVVIPPEERDEELGRKLADEADAVLAWLVSGYLAWQVSGFAEPQQVTQATGALQGSAAGAEGLRVAAAFRAQAGHGVASSEGMTDRVPGVPEPGCERTVWEGFARVDVVGLVVVVVAVGHGRALRVRGGCGIGRQSAKCGTPRVSRCPASPLGHQLRPAAWHGPVWPGGRSHLA